MTIILLLILLLVQLNITAHRFGNSHAMWDHTKLPATRQWWHSHLYLRQLKLVLNLVTPEGCKTELTSLAGYVLMWNTRPKTVTHPSTNWAQRRVTLFMRWMTLRLHQTA